MIQDLQRYEKYLTEYKNIADNTRQSYLRDSGQFVEFMATRRVLIPEEISAEDFIAYQQWLVEQNFKNSTISRKIVSVKAFYEFLYREHIINVETADVMVLPRTERKSPVFLTKEEMDKLVEAPIGKKPKEIRDRAILEFMYATGLKATEIISLQRDQIDLQMDCVTCGKGMQRRTVPFGEKARDALIEYLQEARLYFGPRDEERTVFLNHSGRALSRQGLFKLVKLYGERAEIETVVTPDVIRHSFAVILIENGADLRSVQKMMGHTDLSSTEIYAKRKVVSDHEEYHKAHPRG